MRPDAAPRPRYRNETVYRSAERLLSAPAKTPMAKRASRGIYFVTGLACGLAIAVLLLGPGKKFDASDPRSGKAGSEGFPQSSNRAPARPSTSTQNPRPATAMATTLPVEPDSAPPSVATTTPSVSPAATAVVRQAATTRVPTRTAANAPLPATTYFRETSPVIMRGELRAHYATPIPIEIILHEVPAPKSKSRPTVRTRTRDLDLRSLQGRVRFPQHERERDFAPFHVTGSVDDEKIMLSQIQVARHGAGGAWFGYIIVLHRPPDPTSNEWSGTWNLGVRSGTLTATITSPL